MQRVRRLWEAYSQRSKPSSTNLSNHSKLVFDIMLKLTRLRQGPSSQGTSGGVGGDTYPYEPRQMPYLPYEPRRKPYPTPGQRHSTNTESTPTVNAATRPRPYDTTPSPRLGTSEAVLCALLMNRRTIDCRKHS
jgi:hypothetical protein